MRRKQKCCLYGCLCKHDRLDRQLLLLYRQLCKLKKCVCKTCEKDEKRDEKRDEKKNS